MQKWISAGLLSASLLSFLSAVAPLAAEACACCSDANTLSESPEMLSLLNHSSPVALKGQMGLDIYGNSDGPGLDVGQGLLSGQLIKGNLVLTLKRNQKALGTLTLRPQGQPLHRRIGLDFLLQPDDLALLQKGANPHEVPVYHELSVNVSVTASPELSKALGVSFAPTARLVFHGNSNACWDPIAYDSRWSLWYQVNKGKLSAKGLARGVGQVP